MMEKGNYYNCFHKGQSDSFVSNPVKLILSASLFEIREEYATVAFDHGVNLEVPHRHYRSDLSQFLKWLAP